MKILWICNKFPQIISELAGIKSAAVGGWLDYICKCLIDSPDVTFSIAALGDSNSEGNKNDVSYYLFDRNNRFDFGSLLKKEKPDLIHIWGTEFKHSYMALQAAKECGYLKRCVISIQGMVSIYGKYHYAEGLPDSVIRKVMPRDFLKPSSITQGRNDYLKKGHYEIKALKLVENVIGRTDWDRGLTYFINPEINYYFNNECLRDAFYNNSWDIKKIEKHSIFVSQSNYPVKGFHYVLEALRYILKRFPDTVLYTTGKDLLRLDMLNKLKMTSYQKYIIDLIKKYKLQDHVKFLGTLSEEEMCDRYCRTHVFVSPSTIENSPNSLGEAMLLGCPAVSSDVGGVKNMIMHGEEGYIYQSSAPYMCAYYVCMIFEDDDLALKFSEAGKKHALVTHDREKNYNELMDIYCKISVN